jgi:hypothetical protein
MPQRTGIAQACRHSSVVMAVPGLDPGISPGHPDPDRRAEGSAPLSSPASVSEGRGSTPTLTADGFPVSFAARPSGHDTLPVMAEPVPAIPIR